MKTESGADTPGVVMVVGVNGTGKTTTTGKLARVLVADGRSVVLGAADTFRAAAADQLQTWGERVGARTVRGPEGGDPASIAFDAVKEGVAEGADVVLIDTAGRLHTKTGLMDELGKVKRVVEKHGPLDEILLVLDATTGQNGLIQARVFAEVVDITGIVLTKLDGTAKGGIVVAVQRELGSRSSWSDWARARTTWRRSNRAPSSTPSSATDAPPETRTSTGDDRSGHPEPPGRDERSGHDGGPARRRGLRHAGPAAGSGGAAVADVGERAEQQSRLWRRPGRVQRRRAQPADGAEAAQVRGRGRDVGARPQALEVQAGIIPAHPVQQPRELRGRSGRHEELRPPRRRRADRTQREPHPLQPDQGAPPGRLRHLDHVEGAPQRQQDRRSRIPRPGPRRLAEARARRHRLGERERMRPRCHTGGTPAGALAGNGPRTREHVPAPQSGVLRHCRALRAADAASCAGPHLTNAADREAHAPSNGSDAPVVTTGSPPVTLCVQRWRTVAGGVVWTATRASTRTAPPTPGSSHVK